MKKESLINVEFYLIDAFEISHFKPLYMCFRKNKINAVFVAEPAEFNTSGKWFDYSTAIRMLEEEGLEYRTVCNPDAEYAFSTQQVNVLDRYSDLTIRICMSYGSGLTRNDYMFSQDAYEGYDYKFIHGLHAQQKCKTFFPLERMVIVGYPRYYGIRDEKIDLKLLHQELNIETNKKILCYFPTWDENATIQAFSDVIKDLRDEFYVITKPHHCTYRLRDKKEDLRTLYAISDLVLDGNYDFRKAVMLGDLNLCDARSGAALEACFIQPEKPVVFLSTRKDMKKYFEDELFNNVATVINQPEELKHTIYKVMSSDEHIQSRKRELERHFADLGYECLDLVCQDMLRGKMSRNLVQ